MITLNNLAVLGPLENDDLFPASDREGKIVAAFTDGGIRVFNNGRFEKYPVRSSYPIESVAVSSNGKFIGYCGQGYLGVFTPENQEVFVKTDADESIRINNRCTFSGGRDVFWAVCGGFLYGVDLLRGKLAFVLRLPNFEHIPGPISLLPIEFPSNTIIPFSVAAGQDYSGVIVLTIQNSSLLLTNIPPINNTATVLFNALGNEILSVEPSRIARYAFPDLKIIETLESYVVFPRDADGFSDDCFGLEAYKISREFYVVVSSDYKIVMLKTNPLRCVNVYDFCKNDWEGSYTVSILNCSKGGLVTLVLRDARRNKWLCQATISF